MEESLNYFKIPREKWREYYEKNIVPLTPEELERIKSLNDRISMKDVQEIYMPLVYYLEMQLNVQRFKQEQTARFLDKPMKNVPFVIGIAGSVAVGKSTTARLLKILLKEAFPGKKVQLITTDGFLYPNAKLKERGIMDRKGFPESYDMEKLITFMDQVKNGEKASAPVYSHQVYDIIPNRYDIVDNPNILIVEGINVLQLPSNQRIYVSDYFERPISMPMTAPKTAICTASNVIMVRTWRRWVPTARSIPISWRRSITPKVKVLTIPRMAMITASASKA